MGKLLNNELHRENQHILAESDTSVATDNLMSQASVTKSELIDIRKSFVNSFLALFREFHFEDSFLNLSAFIGL